MRRITNFLRSEDGPTAVEYAVMLALIITMCIGALRLFGSTASGSFVESNNKINAAVGGS